MLVLRNLFVFCSISSLTFVFGVRDHHGPKHGMGHGGPPQKLVKELMKRMMDLHEDGPREGPMALLKIAGTMMHKAMCNASHATGKTAEECSDCLTSINWAGLMMNNDSKLVAPKMCIKEYLQTDYQKCTDLTQSDGLDAPMPMPFQVPDVMKLCMCMIREYYGNVLEKCTSQVGGSGTPTDVFLQTVDCIHGETMQIAADFGPFPVGPHARRTPPLVMMFLCDWIAKSMMMSKFRSMAQSGFDDMF